MIILLIIFGISFGAEGSIQDFGTYGHTTAIEEEDLIEQLQKTIVDIESLQEGLRQKVRHWSPKPVSGLGTECRIHFYDPTITVPFDIKDHKGRVLHTKGTRVNPLHYRSFSQKWVFVDGEKPLPSFDPNTKVILVRGNPFELMKDYALYFDQGGLLVKKFGIQNVPAILEQVGDQIRITEGSC